MNGNFDVRAHVMLLQREADARRHTFQVTESAEHGERKQPRSDGLSH